MANGSATAGERVEYFFDNLLPDSHAIRTRLAKRYAAGSEKAFNLLAAIGRDCVDAIQLLPVREIRKYWEKSTFSAFLALNTWGKNIEFRGNGFALSIDDCTKAKSAD